MLTAARCKTPREDATGSAPGSTDSPVWRWGHALGFRKGANLAVFAVARKLVVAVWYLLKGFFSPLTEPTPLLRRKVEELGEEIGNKRLKEIGFKNSGVFREETLKILIGTT